MNSTIKFRFLTIAARLVFVVSVAGAAQLPATLSPPVVGYVFDGDARAMRPITGVLGNATIGAPVAPGFPLSRLLMLDANHAVALADAMPEAMIVNLERNPPAAAPISGVPANASRAASSSQGTSAAFYYAEGQQALIVTGLPQKPLNSARLALSLFDRPVTHLAVSNDGAMFVFAVREENAEAIYGWAPSWSNARFLASAVSVSGIVVTATGSAIVTDRGSDEVFAIWDANGPAVRQSLAGAREGVANPAGIAVGANQRIYIGNAASATVTVLDSSGRYLKTLQCGCELSGLTALRESVFRLTVRVDQTMFLLDATSNEERILFVPPSRS
jgi:hypothetical protein